MEGLGYVGMLLAHGLVMDVQGLVESLESLIELASLAKQLGEVDQRRRDRRVDGSVNCAVGLQ